MTATVLAAGTSLAPLLAMVVTAAPAAADCGQFPIVCGATLSSSASAAKVGSKVFITIQTGAGDDQCVQLTGDPGGSGIGDGGTPDDTTTPSSGNLTWPVTYSGAPQTVTYTAFYRGSSNANNCPGLSDPDVPIQQTVQVTWVASSPEQNSTVTAAPSTVVADGQSAASVSVVLSDANGNAISGQPVQLTGTGSAGVSPLASTSGPGGQAVFTLTDASAESLTVGAQRRDSLGWHTLEAKATLDFVPVGEAERALSTVTASLSRVPADGLSTSTVTVTLADGSGPLAGRQVHLAASAGGPVITPTASQTDAGGQIAFTVSDSTAQDVTFDAVDLVSTAHVGSVLVRFGGVAAGEQGLSALSLAPSQDVVTTATLPDDGTTAAAVYVQLRCNDTIAICNAAGTAMYLPDLSMATGTIAGATVALVPTSATSATVAKVLDPTNFNGEARFQVTDTVPEQVTFNAVDVTDNVELASVDNSTSPPQVTPLKVTLTFNGPGTPSATTSTAAAAPATVAADGVTASSITVTLRDANRILVPGKTVTLSPGAGSATFSPPQATTDRNGVATFSTVDTHAETVSYLVNDISDNIALTTFPQVTFTARTPSSSTSTVTASPTTLPADGASTSTVTVTITDVNGSPAGGKTVALAQGGGRSTISGPSGATNDKGVTTFTVKDATAEAVTYTATDLTDGFDLTHSATVTFTGKPTSASSTIGADPTSVPANSIATSTISVHLKDQNGNPVAGKAVKLNKVSGGQSTITPVTPGSDTSNQDGTASFSVSDGTAETSTYSASDTTDAVVLSATTKVAFTGPPSGSTSTVAANPTTVPADGTSTSTITVTVLDGGGQPIPGQSVNLTGSSGSRSNITSVTNPTDGAGSARFVVSDATAESVTYSAADMSVYPAQKIFAAAQVTFGAMPAVSSISPTFGPSTGGTKVTISGTGLASATAVRFGSAVVNSVTVNKKSGSLTVTSPPGTGIVDVHVVVPGGTTAAVAADRFRYAPQVSGISPTGGTHSGGTKVTISGTNFAGATGVSFGGTPAASFAVAKNGTIAAVSPPGTAGAAVDVTVTGPGGTSATVPADTFIYA